MKRLLRSVGLQELVPRTLQSGKAWERLITAVTGDSAIQGFVTSHRNVWTTAREQVKSIEEYLKALMAPRQAELDRLATAPGVGTLVAQTFMAVVYDHRRFIDAKHVASYVGLVPRVYQSGERSREGHITRCGSAELRSMLCEAAHHARRTNSPLKRFFARVFFKRGYRMAVVAVAHRLCRILYAMLRDGRPFDSGRVENLNGQPAEVTV